MARSTIEANELGLWRATDGKLTALANVGPANPREFTEVTSTTQVLAPLTDATGGDVDADRRRRRHVNVPRIVAVRVERHLPRRRLDRPAACATPAWCAASACCRCSPALLGLLLLVGALAATWAREGR